MYKCKLQELCQRIGWDSPVYSTSTIKAIVIVYGHLGVWMSTSIPRRLKIQWYKLRTTLLRNPFLHCQVLELDLRMSFSYWVSFLCKLRHISFPPGQIQMQNDPCNQNMLSGQSWDLLQLLTWIVVDLVMG